METPLHEVISWSITGNPISPNLCNRIYPITILCKEKLIQKGVGSKSPPHFCRESLAKVFNRSKAISTFRCGKHNVSHSTQCVLFLFSIFPQRKLAMILTNCSIAVVLIFDTVCIIDMNSFLSNTDDLCTLNK